MLYQSHQGAWPSSCTKSISLKFSESELKSRLKIIKFAAHMAVYSLPIIVSYIFPNIVIPKLLNPDSAAVIMEYQSYAMFPGDHRDGAANVADTDKFRSAPN